MEKSVKIKCLNSNTSKEYPIGTSLYQIIEDQQINLKHRILGARVNNQPEELSYQIFRPKIIEFIDITNMDGMRMYIRSLSFVLFKAVKELYPHAVLKLEHSISKGFYCELDNLSAPLSEQMISDIRIRMRKIIEADIPFVRKEIEVEEAIKLFEENGFLEKAKLFKTCPEFFTSVYYLDDLANYFYGYLVPSTGYLKIFDLVDYFDGMLLRIPKMSNPEEMEDITTQDKLFEIFREYKRWSEILGVSNVGAINEVAIKDKGKELIKICEALHEKKMGSIADQIFKRKDKVRLVLISGPSSSGKTTFCKRLAIQLKVAGLKPIMLSLDNYFVDRELTPHDENGDLDYEALEAIDIKMFIQQYQQLRNGEEVHIPKFSFKEGKRIFDGEVLKMQDDDILLVEGIHAINPKLTEGIPSEEKFNVYISALTQVGIDGHNRIPTTDNRLIRRIVRDSQYRHYTAYETIKRWPSVRRGEEKYIFPYQEVADVMFNSFLIYELSVLKSFAEPLLKEVPEIMKEYSEANRLLKFLSYFKPIPDEEIPPTSILREFLSGSSFSYK